MSMIPRSRTGTSCRAGRVRDRVRGRGRGRVRGRVRVRVRISDQG